MIPVNQAQARFTNTLIDAFRLVPQVNDWLLSKAVVKTSGSKYVSLDIERYGEFVAVDVERGTEGNRNAFSLSANKVFLPPYLREYFDATQLDLYDRAFGSPYIDASVMSQLVETTALRMGILRDKMIRNTIKQVAEVYEFGTVTLSNGDNIDYKRKPESIVNDPANYFATSGVNPYTVIGNGCTFLRTVGKAFGGIYDCIMGEQSLADFLDNAIVKQRNDLKMWKLDDLVKPELNISGGVYHGTITCGSYIVHIWTYPEYYDTRSGSTITSIPYMNTNKCVILPQKPRFILSYAAVPRLLMGTNQSAAMGSSTTTEGAFVIGDYTDARLTAHIFDIKSAPLFIPVTVDQIYTVQVVAS